MNVLRKNANFVKCCHRLLTVVSSKMWMLSCILMHVATDVTATLYDARYLHHYTPTCTLRSTNQYFLDVSRFSTEFGKRSFSYLAPTVWNGLPLNIRLSPTFDTFKCRLKTHLFK